MRANKFANIILSSGILYFVSLLIYGSYRIAYYWSNNYYLLINIVFSSAGILICALAFKLRPNYKINLVLMGLFTLISVYLVEVFLLLEMTPKSKLVKEAHKMGIAFDTRTGEQVIKELRNTGINAIPIPLDNLFHPHGLENGGKMIYPLGGISNATTVHCNGMGKWIIYHSDEHGFNNSKGVFDNEKIDILLVGDSFTHSACVSREENIAGQLQALSKMSIINLGIGKRGPLKELATLKEYGEPLQPKYTFLLYYEGNDLGDLGSEKRSPILLKYLIDDQFSQLLVNKQSEIDDLLIKEFQKELQKNKFLKKILNNLKSIFRLTQLRHRINLFPRPYELLLFKKVLKKARDLTTSWNGKLYFVYLPSWERYTTQVDHHTFYYRDEVLSIVKNLNIPIIDIHEEVFVKHPDPLSLFPFRLHGHYTPEGYHLVSQAIYQYLPKKMPK